MDFETLKTDIVELLRDNLSEDLHYHSLNHTLSVMYSSLTICKEEGISEGDTVLVKTASLLHDVGFIWQYNDHEEKGIEYALNILPQYGYRSEDIEKILGMIAATKVPQAPQNHLDKIICDADLSYLGSDYFHPIGNLLFLELKAKGIVVNIEDWDDLQIKFLSVHSFHTKYAKQHLEPKKQLYLQELKNRVKQVK